MKKWPIVVGALILAALIGGYFIFRWRENEGHNPNYGDVPTWLTFLAAAVGIPFALYQLRAFRQAEEAHEREQAEQVSAFVEQNEGATFLVVTNRSGRDVPSCSGLYSSYGGEGQPEGWDGPTALTQHNLGMIPAGEDKREEIHPYPKLTGRGGLKHAAVIHFSDVEGRHWLRDGNAKLHRIGPDGEMPMGVLPELDEWQDFWNARGEAEVRARRRRGRAWRQLVAASVPRRSTSREDAPGDHQGSDGGGRTTGS